MSLYRHCDACGAATLFPSTCLHCTRQREDDELAERCWQLQHPPELHDLQFARITVTQAHLDALNARLKEDAQ